MDGARGRAGVRVKMLGLVSVLIASVGWGNAALANVWLFASGAIESSAASESAANGNELPELSLEFFDYLGSLVKRDGEWVDPLTLDEQLNEDASSLEDASSIGDAEDASSIDDAKDVSSKDAQTKVSEVEQ